MTKSNNLKYLYRVVYNDGTIYDQNVEDISVSNPDKTCYSDVKVDQVHYFTLSDGIHSYTLDLKDGGFSINGSGKLYLHVGELFHIKLAHFRRVTLSIHDDTNRYSVNFVLGYDARDAEGKAVHNSIIIR